MATRRHIVLIPGSVEECYSLTMEALDLAQRFQTPVFVATDLDLGMNLWLSEPFPYPTKPLERGKVRARPTWSGSVSSSATRTSMATASATGRFRAPSTCWPRTSPAARATTTNRGTASDPRTGRRTSTGSCAKHETARQALPPPVIEGETGNKVGLIAYGGSHFALVEARDQLQEEGISTAYCRIRALPVSDEVKHFIERHLRVYVVEQNRDAQVTSILKSTLSGALADRLIPITHYNGTPLAAQNIVRPI